MRFVADVVIAVPCQVLLMAYGGRSAAMSNSAPPWHVKPLVDTCIALSLAPLVDRQAGTIPVGRTKGFDALALDSLCMTAKFWLTGSRMLQVMTP